MKSQVEPVMKKSDRTPKRSMTFSNSNLNELSDSDDEEEKSIFKADTIISKVGVVRRRKVKFSEENGYES